MLKQLKVKLLGGAKIPARMTAGAAGYDLYAISETYDSENECIVYDTGVCFEIPEGYAGFIYQRSSIYKTSLILTNCVGVVDSDYRGSISFKFKSHLEGAYSKSYSIGDRIGQIVFKKIETPTLFQVDELSETDRGNGGFGHTGLK